MRESERERESTTYGNHSNPFVDARMVRGLCAAARAACHAQPAGIDPRRRLEHIHQHEHVLNPQRGCAPPVQEELPPKILVLKRGLELTKTNPKRMSHQYCPKTTYPALNAITIVPLAMTNGEGFVWVQYTSSLSHWSVITKCCTFHGPSSVAACAVAIPHPQFAW